MSRLIIASVVITAFAVIFNVSCSETTTPAPPTAPTKASNPNPANGAVGIPIDADLSWNGELSVSSGEAGNYSYDLYFGTSSSPELVASGLTSPTYDPGTMVNSTAYYWRVDTKSGKQTTTGDVWSFTTVIGGKYTYEIINSYPHDPGAFTEGLIFDNGFLYEGTGLWGESSLRKVDLTTGEILQSYELPDEYFGEGITALDDKIYQLTYLANVGFVYDKETFELLDQFSYPTEGWGLTNDGEQLIMGDGSATLYFLDPITYQETGTVEVTLDGEPLLWLNELEYIDGYIYINVWTTDLIVIVDPASGDVVGQIDMTGLRWLNSGVLNGTAYDIDDDRLFVTGKKWQKLYEIKLVPTGGN